VGAPVLWHLKPSNFNEKARWALDCKGVPHVRRAVEPGRHVAVAKKLTGERTLPIVEFDGEPIGDSTRIIQELERRWPERPLYPGDRDERRHALELEDFFDEELGPYVRLLVMYYLPQEPGVWLDAFLPDAGAPRRSVVRAGFPLVRRVLRSQFGINEQTVEQAHEKIRAAGRRLRDEVGPSGYLVGETFTVADLALAALSAPAVAPEQFPYSQPHRDHPVLAPLRETLHEAGIVDFTREMYARHRGSSAEIAA
jgi:glutathione S-transferase